MKQQSVITDDSQAFDGFLSAALRWDEPENTLETDRLPGVTRHDMSPFSFAEEASFQFSPEDQMGLALGKLVHCSDEQLADFDIADVNMACAMGLPGADRLDRVSCLGHLDQWAVQIKRYTMQLLPHFQSRPNEYNQSEAYFRSLCMITYLQRDAGVRYNLEKLATGARLDASDTFMHGVIQGDGGTCVSLPVVYAAVGRRLGYPLKLVTARRSQWGHLFVRWDDPSGERLNLEASNRGLNVEDDDYYRTGDYFITPEQEAQGCLLKSLTTRQELACFLAHRGFVWLDAGASGRAADAFVWAWSLHPQNRMLWNTACHVLDEWHSELTTRTPPRFPAIRFRLGRRRRFPAHVPLDMEMDLHYLQVIDAVLNDDTLVQGLRDTTHCGRRLLKDPFELVADVTDICCNVSTHFGQ